MSNRYKQNQNFANPNKYKHTLLNVTRIDFTTISTNYYAIKANRNIFLSWQHEAVKSTFDHKSWYSFFVFKHGWYEFTVIFVLNKRALRDHCISRSSSDCTFNNIQWYVRKRAIFRVVTSMACGLLFSDFSSKLFFIYIYLRAHFFGCFNTGNTSEAVCVYLPKDCIKLYPR